MKRTVTAGIAAAATALLVLAGCSTTPAQEEGGTDITLWLMGGDTPDALRDEVAHDGFDDWNPLNDDLESDEPCTVYPLSNGWTVVAPKNWN